MSSRESQVLICADLRAASLAVAEHVVRSARDAVDAKGTFSIALSGGSTPRLLYGILASAKMAGQVPWEATQVFWSDERCVPPDHEDSNFRMAQETLLSAVPVPAANIHPMRGDEVPEAAAVDYQDELQATLGPDAVIDLVLLGMGPDGHAASLFPDTAALRETTRKVVANFVPSLGSWRLTLTLPMLSGSGEVLFLAAGREKAQMVAKALDGDPASQGTPPAGRVQPVSGKLFWVLDEQAASELHLTD